MTYVMVQDKGRRVRADYQGGAYIELTFGAFGFKPTEVINVWDYETDTAQIPNTTAAIKAAVFEWIASNDEEWPEWYEGYLENARY